MLRSKSKSSQALLASLSHGGGLGDILQGVSPLSPYLTLSPLPILYFCN